MKYLIAVLVVVVLLTGCSNTGPLKIGKDTYTVSTRVAFSGEAGAKGDALNEANIFCAMQGKQMLLKNQKSNECALHGGCGEAEIIFWCLSEDDPRYTEAQLRKDNGVTTIELR